MNKIIITTQYAPPAIGTYSQAVKIANTVYLSGQIPLHPETMQLVGETGDSSNSNDISGISQQIIQVFKNLAAVCAAAGGSLDDIVKLNIYLTDLSCFATLNEIMAQFFTPPYPARAAVGVAQLPRGARVEMDGIMVIF